MNPTNRQGDIQPFPPGRPADCQRASSSVKPHGRLARQGCVSPTFPRAATSAAAAG